MYPFFSVIIPLYNKEDYIANTLKSVLNQTFQDFEVIIVDDGSTDKSAQVVNSFNDKRIQLVKNKMNLGLPNTRNVGISLAQGEIIALLDADDLWTPLFLSEMKLLHDNYPNACLYACDYKMKHSDELYYKPIKNLSKSLNGSTFIVDDFFTANLFHLICTQSGIAIKRNVFSTISFNENIDYAEDIDFYIQVFTKYKLAYSYKALSIIHVNIENQMTKLGTKNKKLPDFKTYLKEYNYNHSLIKFINQNCYFLSIQSRLSNDKDTFNMLYKIIDLNSLNTKQRLLLRCPLLVLKSIKKIKTFLMKQNIVLTTHRY